MSYPMWIGPGGTAKGGAADGSVSGTGGEDSGGNEEIVCGGVEKDSEQSALQGVNW